MSIDILDIVLKSIAASLLGLGAVWAMKRSSAATRHFLLALTLAGLLAVPAVSLFLPKWQVPFLREEVAQPHLVTTASGQGHDAEAQHLQGLQRPPDSKSADSAFRIIGESGKPVESQRHPGVSGLEPLRIENSQSTAGAPVLTIWIIVAFAIGLRILIRLLRLGSLERRLPMSDHPKLQAIVSEHCRNSKRHVLLLEGLPNQSPMTWGLFRPVLLLPSEAGAWPAERLRSVILHELAHIERRDWLWSLFAQCVCALCWFNPVAWIVANRMVLESERAADDRALEQGSSAPEYAAHLLEVLRELKRAGRSDQAALAMARPGKLDGRVQAILEEKRCRRPMRGTAALAWIVAVSGVFIVIGAAGPTINEDDASLPVPNAQRTPHNASLPIFTASPMPLEGAQRSMKMSEPLPKTQDTRHNTSPFFRGGPRPLREGTTINEMTTNPPQDTTHKTQDIPSGNAQRITHNVFPIFTAVTMKKRGPKQDGHPQGGATHLKPKNKPTGDQDGSDFQDMLQGLGETARDAAETVTEAGQEALHSFDDAERQVGEAYADAKKQILSQHVPTQYRGIQNAALKSAKSTTDAALNGIKRLRRATTRSPDPPHHPPSHKKRNP